MQIFYGSGVTKRLITSCMLQYSTTIIVHILNLFCFKK